MKKAPPDPRKNFPPNGFIILSDAPLIEKIDCSTHARKGFVIKKWCLPLEVRF